MNVSSGNTSATRIIFFSQTAREIGPNTVGISIIAPLQYLLITVKVVASEKVSFSNTENTKAIC